MTSFTLPRERSERRRRDRDTIEDDGCQGQRVSFVVTAGRGEKAFHALCQEFGISRPTGYLWVSRYPREGLMGLDHYNSTVRMKSWLRSAHQPGCYAGYTVLRDHRHPR